VNGRSTVLAVVFLIVGLGVGYGTAYIVSQQQILDYRIQALQLQSEISTLRDSYHALQSNYSMLKSNYSSLQQSYQSLLNDYEAFEEKYHSLIQLLDDNILLSKVKSRSMEPALNLSDIVLIKPVNVEEIYASPENGDIIIFRNPSNPSGLPIIHRAIKKIQKDGKTYFITKGDNNPVDDYRAFGWLVPGDYIIGKVIAAIPTFIITESEES